MNKICRDNGGFTLVEILAVLTITGILAAIAAPSFISQKNTMKYAISQTNTLLKTVNLVARANSGNPYRIRPIYAVVNSGGQYQLQVEVNQNGVCSNSISAANWVADYTKSYFLPDGIVIRNAADSANFETLSTADKEAMTICFDGRGTESNGGRTFNLRDTLQSSDIRRSQIAVTAVGDVTSTNFYLLNMVKFRLIHSLQDEYVLIFR